MIPTNTIREHPRHHRHPPEPKIRIPSHPPVHRRMGGGSRLQRKLTPTLPSTDFASSDRDWITIVRTAAAVARPVQESPVANDSPRGQSREISGNSTVRALHAASLDFVMKTAFASAQHRASRSVATNGKISTNGRQINADEQRGVRVRRRSTDPSPAARALFHQSGAIFQVFEIRDGLEQPFHSLFLPGKKGHAAELVRQYPLVHRIFRISPGKVGPP